jgi:hypothetical protein
LAFRRVPVSFRPTPGGSVGSDCPLPVYRARPALFATPPRATFSPFATLIDRMSARPDVDACGPRARRVALPR